MQEATSNAGMRECRVHLQQPTFPHFSIPAFRLATRRY